MTKELSHSLCLAVLAAFLMSGCFENQGLSSKAKYKIAYNVFVPGDEKDDNYEVFTMNLDGSEKTNLTNHPDVAWTYLAVKEKILFISDRDTCYRCFFLFEMNADGSEQRQVTDFILRDSWMGVRNDGSELIVNPSPRVDSVFYIIDRNGTLLQKLPIPLPAASDPAFSPDGQYVAFRGGTRRTKREPGYTKEIYRVNADGTNLVKLTQYPPYDTTAAWYSYRAGPPRWHPTEDFITYHSFQEGKYSLFGVKTDGSEQWKLTDLDSQEGWHEWSPDGKWLAIEMFDKGQNQFHIGLMDWETKELQVLTDTTYRYQQAPVFVERGRKMVR